MTESPDRPGWIPKLEIADAQIKWVFSHFDGREDTFNQEGDHNFTVIIPEREALELKEQGWSIREVPGYEEGDPPEFLLKVKISSRFFDELKIYLIKNNRKYRAEKRDLADIKRSTTTRIDLVIKPSRWTHGNNSGVTAYVEELYAHIEQSRFADMYDDLETI